MLSVSLIVQISQLYWKMLAMSPVKNFCFGGKLLSLKTSFRHWYAIMADCFRLLTSLVVFNRDPNYLHLRQSPSLLAMLMLYSSVLEGFIWRLLSSRSACVRALISFSAITSGQFTPTRLRSSAYCRGMRMPSLWVFVSFACVWSCGGWYVVIW